MPYYIIHILFYTNPKSPAKKIRQQGYFSLLPYCHLTYFLFYAFHDIIYCFVKDDDIQPVSDLYPEAVCGLNLLLQWCYDDVHLCFKKLLYLIGIKEFQDCSCLLFCNGHNSINCYLFYFFPNYIPPLYTTLLNFP